MLQILIEAEDHDDLVRQVGKLANTFGVGQQQIQFVEGYRDDIETVRIPDNEQQEQEQAPTPPADKVPNPTKKTVALAEELGVDIASITPGSGKDGRVTQVDVKAAAAKQPAPEPEPEPEQDSEPEPEQEEATVPSTDPFDESTPSDDTPIEPTKDNVALALRAVNAEHGMDACMAILKSYDSAQRIGEVAESHYPAFIESCAEKIGVDRAGLKQKMVELAA